MPLHGLGLLLLLQELRLRRFVDWMLEQRRLSLPPSRLLHRVWSHPARMWHDYGRKRVLQSKSPRPTPFRLSLDIAYILNICLFSAIVIVLRLAVFAAIVGLFSPRSCVLVRINFSAANRLRVSLLTMIMFPKSYAPTAGSSAPQRVAAAPRPRPAKRSRICVGTEQERRRSPCNANSKQASRAHPDAMRSSREILPVVR